MKIFKNIFALLLLCVSLNVWGATNSVSDNKYWRSSICQFMVMRTDQPMHKDIKEKYLEIPTPDQYDNHDLSIRLVNVGKKGKYADSIDVWLRDNYVASRLVGKWFNRNLLTGECDINLLKSRSVYNATELDRELAKRSARGLALLEDTGDQLIGNTFVLVHEAHYIDNAKRSQNVSTGLKIFGALTGAFIGVDLSDVFDNLGDLAATFKGFRVKIHTRLYQLVWDDETSGSFYKEMYSPVPDEKKMNAFESKRGQFRLKYLGEVESSGSKNSFMGISEEHPEIMIRKACQRAIDDNVRDLQRDFETFRVKSPIKQVAGKEVQVAIGMKEGINEDSEYEVLEPQEKDGKYSYKRVGTIKPVKGIIWDNRFMAKEEGSIGSDLTATTFVVKSGSTPYEGLLVRQIK